jgi:hypothetical protein
MKNSRQGIKHERIKISAYLPMMALAVNERASNG